jgi:3-dehydroquinate dehydratase type I
VDIQGYTFDLPSKTGFHGEDKYSFTKGSPKEIVTDAAVIERQSAFIEKVHAMGGEVLLSCHPGIPMNREQVVELALFLEKRNPDIIKIVTIANSMEDMLESLHAMVELKKTVKTPISYHSAGKFGGLSRVICPALGGQIAFCVDRFSESSTFEQLELASAKQTIENLEKLL